MAELQIVLWEDKRCKHEEDGQRCTGIQIGEDDKCFPHTDDGAARERALASVQDGGDIDFTRGVSLTDELLAQILERAPAEDGHPVLTNVDFTLATFSGTVGFYEATFSGDATFDSATFSGDARFDGATFSGTAGFYEATFTGHGNFGSATFSGDALFDGATFCGNAGFWGATFGEGGFARATFCGNATFYDATFSGDARFYDATFSGDAAFGRTTFSAIAGFSGATFCKDAEFGGATFSGDAGFGGAKISGDARFHGATFSMTAGFYEATFFGGAWFSGATFSGSAAFGRTTFCGNAMFDRTTFQKARKFGPSIVLSEIDFGEAVFSQNIDIEMSSSQLSCQRTKFRDGANLKVRWAVVRLDDADLSRPCLFAWAPESNHPLEIVLPALFFALPSEPPHESSPRIVSLRRATLAGLAVSAVDLSACRFAGAHNLDQLRIEGRRQFAERPSGWHKQLGWPPVWKWTVRRALAEEHEWRHRHERGIRKEGWYPQACQPPRPEEIHPLSPGDIQNVYRDLRKGREDSKDEPGAADFYYGEMEMRRAAIAWSFEKVLFLLYWLVSGYGLRASRALLALGLTVLLCSVALDSWGVPKGDERDFAEIVVFSMQSTISLLRAPDLTLTLPGQLIQIALRLLGPLFFGLALLSLRGRVKR
jgi:hypothetical protein